MKLWLLKCNLDLPSYENPWMKIDQYRGFVIRADNEDDARAVASHESGDDWVISELYSRSDSKNQFWLLPQMSFPVGLMANTFLDRSIFSGLVPPNPYIFHANYLVGSQRKALMMANMLRVFNNVNSISVGDNLRIKIRKYLVPIKRVTVAFKFTKLFK